MSTKRTRSEVCPVCGRSVPLTKASYFKSHRTAPGRFGRGPYCAGSGIMPVGPGAAPHVEAKAPAAPAMVHAVASIRPGVVVITTPSGDAVEYSRDAIHIDRNAGPLKPGDRLERDPDKLVAFVRVGDFK